jgi:hypothetical protein
MQMPTGVVMRRTADLVPYANNARTHTPEPKGQTNRRLGLDEVPCIASRGVRFLWVSKIGRAEIPKAAGILNFWGSASVVFFRRRGGTSKRPVSM